MKHKSIAKVNKYLRKSNLFTYFVNNLIYLHTSAGFMTVRPATTVIYSKQQIMKNIGLLILATALVLSSCSTSKNSGSRQHTSIGYADKTKDAYEKYILTYYPLAVEQMEQYDIPASITLAQGLLESGAGNSSLTKKSNNHFGIKANSNWRGPKTSSIDNGRKCYFRVYDHPRGSYEDHSKFLTENSRYSSLFRLKQDDYKGWAKGLKKAGYAEDPAYPQKLISLIERYELYKYDDYSTKDLPRRNTDYTQATGSRPIYRSSELLYVIANTGDTFKSLAKETGVSRRKLIKYNDLYKDYPIKAGDIIYLEKKHNKALKPHNFHTTKDGESLHSIAQKYGIKLKKLYNMNPQFKTYATLKVGDIVRLR